MTTTTPVEAKNKDVVTLEAHRSRSLWYDAWHRLVRNKAAVVGMVLIGIFVFVALFAPVLAPRDPLQINDGKGYLPPFWVNKGVNGKAGDPEFILGTDTIGRDLFSRLIYGARVSLFVAIFPVIIILIIGVVVGLISGYTGGTLDDVLMRITDVFYAFPDLLFFILLVVTLQDAAIGKAFNGLLLLFFALALVSWVGVARLARGSVLSLKEQEFVEAAQAMGASNGRIMRAHIFPNILSPLIVLTAFMVPRMIITEATLGYLGLGLRPATDPSSFFITSWGVLMLEGKGAMTVQPWILLAPALCVGVVVLAFTFVGDGLRDALDPKTR